MKTIGIVAVTPKSGIECFQYIIKESKKRNGGMHPQIIMECTSIHEYMNAIENGDKGSLINLLLSAVNSLFNAGASLAIIPNNSSLGVFDKVSSRSPIKILSMSDAVKEECQVRNISSVCIIGPTPVLKNRLYHKSLECLQIPIVVPENPEQDFLHAEIMRATKSGQEIPSDVQKKIQQIIDNLKLDKKFGAIIAACSEIQSILIKKDNIAILNPFEILAEKALVEATI